MGEVSTTGGGRGPDPAGIDPPRGDEGLDDWFARRLEAQGIKASRPGFATARYLAVGSLVVALLLLGWVVAGIGSSGSAATTTAPPTTPHTSTTPTGGKKTHPTTKVAWRSIPLTVLNGYGGTGAATTAETQLKSAGWNVTGAANAGTTAVTQTVVVFVPGQKAAAVVVGKRLHLPVAKIADVAGIQPASIDGVAVVLGPNGLPSLSAASGTAGTT
jgi:LytR cell envelope-related transcriptional attenuator